MKREWVSYDPRENKLECPLRSNGGTRIFVRHSHKDNGYTQDICVTFMQRIVWDSSFQKKRKKDVAVHTT